MDLHSTPPRTTYKEPAPNPQTPDQGGSKPKKGRNRRVFGLDIWNKVAILWAVVFALSCSVVYPVFFGIINDPAGLQWKKSDLKAVTTSRLYDCNGELVTEFGSEIREDVTYDQIPQSMIDAFLSIEDSRFFKHNGFDLPRFLSALGTNVLRGDLGQGGSTLTMQMIDNSFTMNKMEKIQEEKGYVPLIDKLKIKVQEVYLAMYAEGELTKQDIFEYYINRIWFGSGGNTRGLQKACKYYFNKDVSQLTLGESAFLAGAVNSPGIYNPIKNKYMDDDFDYLKSATARRNVTLQLMLNHGYITEEEYNLTVNSKLEFALRSYKYKNNDPNEAYIDQVLEEVKEITGQDPLVVPMEIYTALNQDLQAKADAVCKNKVSSVVYPNDKFDIGFTLIDNDTGEIMAVGPGREYHDMEIKIDNSTDRKQPGSTMKPILAYAATFDLLGWSTRHTVNDVAKDYWRSGVNLQNSDGVYRGPMSLQDALGLSKNTTAAQAMIDLIGSTNTDYWRDYCKKLGYDDDVVEEFNEQYSIGGSSMFASPIQQASAYSMLGNGGVRVEAHRVRKVINRQTGEEYEGDSTEYTLISKPAAFMMATLLEKVVTGGYQNFNEVLAGEYPVYGKSGTTDWGDVGLVYGIPRGVFRDEWSLAYTDNFTIATWTGYTERNFKQGYYPSFEELYNYKTAFYCSKYMLDAAQGYAKNGKYEAIARPEGVADYQGGFIKNEFAAQGDVTAIVKDDKKEEKEKQEEPTMAEKCDASGGEWDEKNQKCWAKTTHNDEEAEKTPQEVACEASGGVWAGACVCPTGTTDKNGVCVVETVTPEPEPDPEPSPTPDPSPGPTPEDEIPSVDEPLISPEEYAPKN